MSALTCAVYYTHQYSRLRATFGDAVLAFHTGSIHFTPKKPGIPGNKSASSSSTEQINYQRPYQRVLPYADTENAVPNAAPAVVPQPTVIPPRRQVIIKPALPRFQNSTQRIANLPPEYLLSLPPVE